MGLRYNEKHLRVSPILNAQFLSLSFPLENTITGSIIIYVLVQSYDVFECSDASGVCLCVSVDFFFVGLQTHS